MAKNEITNPDHPDHPLHGRDNERKARERRNRDPRWGGGFSVPPVTADATPTAAIVPGGDNERVAPLRGATAGAPGIATHNSLRCRCVWQGERCPHPATQEDGFCDWCGIRSDEQLMGNPNTILGPDGEFLGLGGGGYAHVDPDRTPDACWMEP